jgi:hypothetical protein
MNDGSRPNRARTVRLQIPLSADRLSKAAGRRHSVAKPWLIAQGSEPNRSMPLIPVDQRRKPPALWRYRAPPEKIDARVPVRSETASTQGPIYEQSAIRTVREQQEKRSCG